MLPPPIVTSSGTLTRQSHTGRYRQYPQPNTQHRHHSPAANVARKIHANSMNLELRPPANHMNGARNYR